MNTKHKNVTRMDNYKTGAKGWYLRKTIEGESFKQFFNDGVYGGKQKALTVCLEKKQELDKIAEEKKSSKRTSF